MCDCGNYINVIGNDLTRTETSDHKPKTHCGCKSSENRSKSQRKGNTYHIDGDVVIGITNNTNEEFYNDIEDMVKIQDYTWFVHIDQTGYKSLQAKVPGTDKHIKMTALLGYKYYDHKNRNTLDNRKNNLRPATNSENMKNRSLFSNNKSGVTGVWFLKDRQKWRAEIKMNKKSVYLGDFINKDDAIEARLQAEADYYGEFAPQKCLFEKYNIKIKQND